MDNLFCHEVDTPVGIIDVISDEQYLRYVRFVRKDIPRFGKYVSWDFLPPVLAQAVDELRAYFAGELHEFTVPWRISGTSFQMAVWQEMTKIEHGTTMSYGELASRIGRKKACRAVGQACNSNPLAIVVPCHRVIGKNGRLTGFGGGLEIKKWLLDWEKSVMEVKFPGQ